jgi:predicted TPR repeat methyltransferase
VQTSSGGQVATFAVREDAEAVCKLHNDALTARPGDATVIAELRQQCQAQAEGWKEEARLRAEDAQRHQAEIESLTSPPKPKSKVDEVIEKTEGKPTAQETPSAKKKDGQR